MSKDFKLEYVVPTVVLGMMSAMAVSSEDFSGIVCFAISVAFWLTVHHITCKRNDVAELFAKHCSDTYAANNRLENKINSTAGDLRRELQEKAMNHEKLLKQLSEAQTDLAVLKGQLDSVRTAVQMRQMGR